MVARQKVTDDQIVDAYKRGGSCAGAAALLGINRASIHERLKKIGHELKRPRWTDADDARLMSDYLAYRARGAVQELADEMGRTGAFVCRKARSLGLTDRNRSAEWLVGKKQPGKWLNREHPRGMAGKRHSTATRQRIAQAGHARWQAASEEERDRLFAAQIEGRKMAGNKRFNPGADAKKSWKAGWREIGGRRIYFRSRWEFNYALYLEACRNRGLIKQWDYERKTFWFEGIKRGVCSYKPDFYIIENNGNHVWHEVKGWMDNRSRVALKRMAKYFPNEKIKIIDKARMQEIFRKYGAALPDWER